MCVVKEGKTKERVGEKCEGVDTFGDSWKESSIGKRHGNAMHEP